MIHYVITLGYPDRVVLSGEDNEDSIPDSHSFMMYDGGLCVGYPQKHIMIQY